MRKTSKYRRVPGNNDDSDDSDGDVTSTFAQSFRDWVRETHGSTFSSEAGDSVSTRGDVGSNTEGSGGHGGNSGGSGQPIPLMHVQHERKETIYTAKAAGTTYVRAANNGTGTAGDNLWTNFPWEFPRFFISNDEFQQIYSTHLYWKCESIRITFKNPLCIQSLGTNAAGLVQSGTNNAAQLFGYCDVNYLTAINDKPGPHANTYTGVDFNNWMTSWRQHGYLGGATDPLPQYDVPDRLFTSIDPDIKEIGMGPGQKMDFGWSIKNDFWRGTTEFANSGPITGTERMPRFDPYMGYVAMFNAINEPPGTGQMITYISPSSSVIRGGLNGFSMSEVPIGASGATGGTFPNVVPYACGDPIPKLWLQLQPQLSGLETGTGNSICQLQFELSMTMRLMGRVPRRNRIEPWGSNDMYKSEYGNDRIGMHTIPTFKPAMSTFNAV